MTDYPQGPKTPTNTEGKIIFVTGGREYGDYTEFDEDETGASERDHLEMKLDAIRDKLGVFILATNHATFSESYAVRWAHSRGVQCVIWQISDHLPGAEGREKTAEIIANTMMPYAVVSLPGGCEILIQKCRGAGSNIWRIKK